MNVGDRVRVKAPKAPAHNWGGTVVIDLAPVCCHIPGTLLVRWDGSGKGPERYPDNCLEPLPPPNRSILLVTGGVAVSDELIRYAIARSPWELAHMAVLREQLNSANALAYAVSQSLPHQSFADFDRLLAYWQSAAKFPPAVIAIPSGQPHGPSKEILAVIKHRKVDYFVLNLQEINRSIQVWNLKTLPPELPHRVYIGRDHPQSGHKRSPLCNSFSTSEYSNSDACELFRQHRLYPALEQRSGEIWGEIQRLTAWVLEGKPLNLVCHCVPAECHGHDVAAAISAQVRQRLGIES